MDLASIYGDVRVTRAILNDTKKKRDDVDPRVRRKRDMHNEHVRAHRRRRKEVLEALKNELKQKTEQLNQVLKDFLVQDAQLRLLESFDGISRDTLWRSYGRLVHQREQLLLDNMALCKRRDEYEQFFCKLDHSLDVVANESKTHPHDSTILMVNEMSHLPQNINFQPLTETECQLHIRDAYERVKQLRLTFEEWCSTDCTPLRQEFWSDWKVCYDDPTTRSNSALSGQRDRETRFRFVKELTRRDLSIDDVGKRFWQVHRFPELFGNRQHSTNQQRILQQTRDTAVTHQAYPDTSAQLLELTTISAVEGSSTNGRMLAFGKVLNPDECVADLCGFELGPWRWIREGLRYFSIDFIDATAGTMRLEYGGVMSWMSKDRCQREGVAARVVLAAGQQLLRAEQAIFGTQSLLHE